MKKNTPDTTALDGLMKLVDDVVNPIIGDDDEPTINECPMSPVIDGDELDPDNTTNDLDLSILDDLDNVVVPTPKRGRAGRAVSHDNDRDTKTRKRLTTKTLSTQMDKVLRQTAKSLSYSAVEYTQGRMLMYVCSVPFRDLQYLNCFETQDLTPEMRSQREITPSRAIAIANYLLDRSDNNQPYIFNAVTIGIDTSLGDHDYSYGDGMINIPSDAFLSIYDGQHRVTGAILAYANDPEKFIDDSLPVIFTPYSSIEDAQQLFSDINANSAKVNKSLTTLYDHTDPDAAIVRTLLNGIPFLRYHVDKEKTTVSPKGSHILTIISLGNFIKNMFGKADLSAEDKVSIATKYWEILIQNISEFNQVSTKKLAVSSLRTDTVFSSTATIEALGCLFNTIYTDHPETWETEIKALDFNKIDWHKLSPNWNGVLIVNNKMVKSKATVTAMAELIFNLAS